MLGCSVCDKCDAFTPNQYVDSLCANCNHINTAHSREVADSILNDEEKQVDKKAAISEKAVIPSNGISSDEEVVSSSPSHNKISRKSIVMKKKVIKVKELDEDVRKNLFKKKFSHFMNKYIHRLPKEVQELIYALEMRRTDTSAELTGIKLNKFSMQKLGQALSHNTSLQILGIYITAIYINMAGIYIYIY